MNIYDYLSEAATAYPYYQRGFAALTPVEVPRLSTFAVDKFWRLYWSQESLKHFQYHKAGTIRHELEHLLREHAERINGRIQRPWNIACDAEINDDIDDLPPYVIFPSTLKKLEGLAAEDYYMEDIDISAVLHGSGTGEAGEWELDPPKTVEEGVDELSANTLRDQISEDIKEYAKRIGNVPKGVLLWANARCTGRLPIIHWKTVVRRRFQKIVAGTYDYSYTRISRRQEPRERVLLPARISYQPRIAVVVDTSGSMDNYGDWVAGCIKDISRIDSAAILIDCDAKVYSIRTLKSWKDVHQLRGGGGTDMRLGVEAAKGKGDLIVLLTDGETPWPSPWPQNLVAVLPSGTVIYNI